MGFGSNGLSLFDLNGLSLEHRQYRGKCQQADLVHGVFLAKGCRATR
jgi:hypothetical protein